MGIPDFDEEMLLNFIESYFESYGYPPSSREMVMAMAKELGYRSTSNVEKLLDSLEYKGLISRKSGKARTVKSLGKPRQQRGIPFWGTIAAGGIVESFTDHPLEFYAVSEALNKPENYALRVIGDSMIDEHICNNDVVILSSNLEANRLKPGKIVAAQVAGEGTTLKRFYQEGAYVSLEPANSSPDFKVMKRHASQVQIQGVLVFVGRAYSH